MEDQTKVTTEAEAVSNLALAASGVVPIDAFEVGGVDFIAYKNAANGVTVERMAKRDDHGLLLDKPSHVAQAVTLETEDSLAQYVRDFKVDGTRLFAEIGANTIVAIIDYHEGRTSAVNDLGGEHSVSADDEGRADFTDHRATLKLPFSEQWGIWTGADGTLMDQLAFARFIHENQQDVEDPSGADLLEVVRDLRGSRTKRFTGDLNLNASGTSFEYEDRAGVSAKDSVTIPDAFVLRIPVYFGGQPVEVFAQLRHDVDDGGALKLGFKLLRRETVRQEAFQAVVEAVSTNAGVPAVYGKVVAPGPVY